ncbi:hypothetical protein [Cellulosimicrobium marinum]|uniref:hypothetical protein n=1 Tax=Cellulosimicrobium marinum TaxID=1638992 RepID=UPI001E6316E5|nr:hypothetical protein [Cellulosimicrobium marinum]MCB7136935.1 hypothetical protein [Cellulosimicrobium marinum]
MLTPDDDRIHLARDHPEERVRHASATGEWERLRHGAYRDAPPPQPSRHAAGRERLLDTARAVHRSLRADHVFSHTTAALVHRLRLWETPDRTDVVQSYRRSGSAAQDLRRHVGSVAPADRRVVRGLPVTSLPRTVADCLRTLPALDGLVLADSALAAGVRREEVAVLLDAAGSGRGTRRARHVLALADDGAESAWESWMRYLVLRLGLPRPTTQVPLRTEVGDVRADVGWPAWRLLLEFDGLVKYRTDRGGVAPASDPGSVLVAEKRRQEAIERLGFRVLRCTAYDDPSDVARRVLRRVPPEVMAGLRVDRALPPLRRRQGVS